MKRWKKTLGIAVSVAGVLIVGATFFSVAGTDGGDVVEIRLAHNQAAGSEIAGSIAKISEFAAEDPSQNLKVSIYA
ncbi:MAG: C4-dicarboxylate ABC transporter, partial [Lachnospiraceae bacterium]|nr:C4-dicarboxylate ABC transporter [Lachnospiraceae bacterium]